MSRHRLAQPAAGACCAMLIVACVASPSGPPGAVSGTPASSATGTAGAVVPAEAVRWTIGPSLVECSGVGPMWCLQYRDAPDGAWKRHYGRIEGFEFRPGDEVELAVRDVIENVEMKGFHSIFMLEDDVDSIMIEAEAIAAKARLGFCPPEAEHKAFVQCIQNCRARFAKIGIRIPLYPQIE